MPSKSLPSSSSTSSADQALYDWDYLCKFILIGDSSVGKSAILRRATDDRFLAEEAEPTVGVEFGSVTLSLRPEEEEEDNEEGNEENGENGNEATPSTSVSTSSNPSKAPPRSARSARSSSHRPPNVKIQIWDTSGSEAFRGITRSYYRGAAGCLLVYDVTHRPSFSNAKGWLKDVREHAEEDAVIVLVGNRIDLVRQGGEEEEEGQTGTTSVVGAGSASRKVGVEEAQEWAKSEGILFVETSAKTGQNVRYAFERCVREIHKRFVASQSSSSSSSSMENNHNNNRLLKSRTGGRGRGRGSDGQIRLDDQGVGVMARSGCCTIM